MQKRVAENLIKPVEYEDFWSRKSKKCPKMIKKHYLEKVFATSFQDVKTLIKPMENKLFQNAKTHGEKPYKTWLKMIISSHFRKKCSKISKKHYLEKVFGSRFRNDEKPYKTNGKRMNSEPRKSQKM